MIEFIIKLYDDASVIEKQTVMDNMEVMFDDERNTIPDEYYTMIENMRRGQSIWIRMGIV